MQTVVIIICVVFLTGIFSFITIVASLFNERGDLTHKVVQLWGKSVLASSRINVFVKGSSNIDPSGTYIFMSNHQSNFDIPVLQAYLSPHFKWLAKAELFNIPVLGHAMKRAGHLSIDRSDRAAAIRSLAAAAKTISRGVSVLIFPEGTRSRDGNIQPFKKGGFFLAVDSGIPVVPVIIHGTWKIMTRDRLFISPGNVILEVAKPIETSGYTRDTKDDLMEKVRSVICESFERAKEDTSLCLK